MNLGNAYRQLYGRHQASYLQRTLFKGRVADSSLPEEEVWKHYFTPQVLSAISHLIAGNGVRRLMDIGSGRGEVTLQIGKNLTDASSGYKAPPALELTAIDFEPGMVRTIEDRFNKIQSPGFMLNAVQADAFNGQDLLQKFKPDSFDRILLSSIFHPEQEQEKRNLMYDVKRLLKRGGKAVFVHWNKGFTERGPQDHLRPTPDEIRVLGNKAGLKQTHYQQLSEGLFAIVLEKV